MVLVVAAILKRSSQSITIIEADMMRLHYVRRDILSSTSSLFFLVECIYTQYKSRIRHTHITNEKVDNNPTALIPIPLYSPFHWSTRLQNALITIKSTFHQPYHGIIEPKPLFLSQKCHSVPARAKRPQPAQPHRWSPPNLLQTSLSTHRRHFLKFTTK